LDPRAGDGLAHPARDPVRVELRLVWRVVLGFLVVVLVIVGFQLVELVLVVRQQLLGRRRRLGWRRFE